jgi:hypothetical protein
VGFPSPNRAKGLNWYGIPGPRRSSAREQQPGDLVEVGDGWQLRISRTGQLAVSSDNGASFVAVPGSGGLPSAERRIFVSHPATPSLMATAPLLGQHVAYSPTLGASSVQTTLADCDVRGLALPDGELLIPCNGSEALAIAAP